VSWSTRLVGVALALMVVLAALAGLSSGADAAFAAVSGSWLVLLTQVAAVAPDAPEVLWYLGVVAARDGRTAEAREKWTKLLAALPADGEDAKMVQAALAQLPDK
jgi:Flp pilus assembly protein TadD